MAKKAWLEERQVQRSQDQMPVRTLSSNEDLGRTMQFTAGIEANVMALTPEQISDAFRRRIDPSAISVFKAGDFKKGAFSRNSPPRRHWAVFGLGPALSPESIAGPEVPTTLLSSPRIGHRRPPQAPQVAEAMVSWRLRGLRAPYASRPQGR